MQLGFIGLGKMGALMVEALLEKGHDVVATDVHQDVVRAVSNKGGRGVGSVKELVEALSGNTPCVVWLMVPHGDPVDAVLSELQPLLSKGDIVIDGGNSFYKHTLERAERLAAQGIEYMDCGTSGGLEGARHGACLMIGGSDTAFKIAEPIFQSLAQDGGYAHLGPVGAGHYAKMVHNGVEYAMVQAYGEGFELLKNAPFEFDLRTVADNWNHGSIVRSFVLGLAVKAFEEDSQLELISDEVGGGSTGEWTIEASIDSKTAIPVMYASLAERYKTRRPESFASKVVAALRNQWGGHEVKKH